MDVMCIDGVTNELTVKNTQERSRKKPYEQDSNCLSERERAGERERERESERESEREKILSIILLP